jgi:ubiquinone/menaquinone biosynthesis C-methylase UbiE
MAPTDPVYTRIEDELTLLERLVPLAGAHVIEAGCGTARLARGLLARHPDAEVTGLEVDERALASIRQAPAPGLHVVRAGAERIPFAASRFDGAMMLKSLHHVPAARMDAALAELARVVRPGGWLYVSEPVYAGALNELVRLYNDEGAVRAHAQQALDRALAQGHWLAAGEHFFDSTVHFADADEFERRMMRPSFAEFRVTDRQVAEVRAAFARQAGPGGATFTRPMHVRLFRRPPGAQPVT